MNTISAKFIKEYLTEQYGECRHCPKRMAKAIRLTANEFKLNKIDLFHYIVERASTIMGSQNYGFDTAYGREIRNRFESNYYSFKK